MSPKSKRPLSVWIAQIVLGIYAFGTVLIVLWGLYKGLTEGIPNPELYLVTTVGILTFAAVFFGGVWGMAIRKPWGRWLGVAGLTILLIAAALEQTSRWLSGIDRESGPVSISLFFRVLLVLGLAFLAYKVAAGDAAEEFFKGKSTEVPETAREDSAK
jgi:hypothetical protein